MNETVTDKINAGIPGFDFVSMGGVPQGRSIIVAGSAGTGKTIFCAQFLAQGYQEADVEPGVFVTFEERAYRIRANMESFGWPVGEWEDRQQWAFVDAAPRVSHYLEETGEYRLDALLSRVRAAVEKTRARRVAIDSISALYPRFLDADRIREELGRLIQMLTDMGTTVVITAERRQEYGDVGRYGVEEFIPDGVIILRNVLESEHRRRTLEILKLRNTTHRKGEYPFTIRADRGLVVVPLSSIALDQPAPDRRVSSGHPTLDELTGGGFFSTAIVLVAGASGSGKSLLASHFASRATPEERSLYLGFEESRPQILRNAHGWGMDFERLEAHGSLVLSAMYPEAQTLEDHLIVIKDQIDALQPRRIVIDSLTALERIASERGFKAFVVALLAYIKTTGATAVLTAASPGFGYEAMSVTEAHISSLTDTIIGLRIAGLKTRLTRSLVVLKMRGSQQHPEARSFTITGSGLRIHNEAAG